MLRINRYKSTLTVSLMFCLLSTMSCGFDDGYDNEDQNDDAVRVAFRMSYANGNTRAANEGWDDYDPKDDGTAYENAINTEQLQIKVCDENGTIIGDVENVIAINNGTSKALSCFPIQLAYFKLFKGNLRLMLLNAELAYAIVYLHHRVSCGIYRYHPLVLTAVLSIGFVNNTNGIGLN